MSGARSHSRRPHRIAAALLLAATSLGASGHPETNRPGTPAPDFRLPDLTGQDVDLDAYRGRPVLVHFWASWCQPCREEMPHIQNVYEDLQADGFVVLGINAGDSPELAEAFAKRFGLSFPIPLDKNWDTATAYGVMGLPVTFFIDRSGTIVDSVMGGTLTESSLTAQLRELGMIGHRLKQTAP